MHAAWPKKLCARFEDALGTMEQDLCLQVYDASPNADVCTAVVWFGQELTIIMFSHVRCLTKVVVNLILGWVRQNITIIVFLHVRCLTKLVMHLIFGWFRQRRAIFVFSHVRCLTKLEMHLIFGWFRQNRAILVFLHVRCLTKALLLYKIWQLEKKYVWLSGVYWAYSKDYPW